VDYAKDRIRMTDDPKPRWEGPNVAGPANLSPYPVSRLAPVHDLVDLAAEVQRADATLATVTGGKLVVIAEQIRALQQQAEALLARAHRDAELHRAQCRFEKRPGQVYHLYRRHDDGALWFSLLGPDEWLLPQAQDFVGSYRLEADMSFTPLEEVERRDNEDAQIARLLGR